METKKFKSKTRFVDNKNIKIDGVWEIALDIGYSGVKFLSPNKYGIFPFYAKKVSSDILWAQGTPKNAILYREYGSLNTWLIGEEAYNQLSDGDTSDSEQSLYGRDRYYNPMFKVISECGFGISLLSNSIYTYSEKETIVVQTGLPERYLNDSEDLIDALSGTHRFALKVGTSEWTNFNFTIDRNNIYVMSQPKGSLLSTCIDNSGNMTMSARDILRSSTLVFDPGFGTLDFFTLTNGCVRGGETFDTLGMKRVFEETINMIHKEYGKKLSIVALQKYLADGSINTYDRRTLTSKTYDFTSLLSKANVKVCEEAIAKLSEMDLSQYKYLIITGGTGAAWGPILSEKLKGLSTLTVLFANVNDTSLSIVFSNVRGYYLNRYAMLAKEEQNLKEKGA